MKLEEVALGVSGIKAMIAVAKIDRLACDAGFVLKITNEAEKNGIGGFIFCDLPDIDATTSAGRMVLTAMSDVTEFEAHRISERTKKALAAAKVEGVNFGVGGRGRIEDRCC